MLQVYLYMCNEVEVTTVLMLRITVANSKTPGDLHKLFLCPWGSPLDDQDGVVTVLEGRQRIRVQMKDMIECLGGNTQGET